MKTILLNDTPATAKEISRSQSHALVQFDNDFKYHVPLLFWDSRAGQYFDQAWGLHLSWRDINPFAHWGTGEDLSSFADAERRQLALGQGLRDLASRHGVTLREPLHINTNGEYALAVSNGTARDGENDPCGKFGDLAAVLAQYSPRCGMLPTKFMSPDNGWCYMHHFNVQKMLEEQLSSNP